MHRFRRIASKLQRFVLHGGVASILVGLIAVAVELGAEVVFGLEENSERLDRFLDGIIGGLFLFVIFPAVLVVIIDMIEKR